MVAKCKKINHRYALLLLLCLLPLTFQVVKAQNNFNNKQIENLKEEAVQNVEEKRKFIQVMVDKIYSFGELGMQEFETSKYITSILEENGFSIERDISGIPTAWMATWGNGEPVIALGSDLDGIPKSSQKPGVAYHDPIIKGAPGHGEGHNSGQSVVIAGVLAVKEIMERENMPGTIKIWPGVAEEQLASKAFYVRDGYFDDVDICIFTHVSDNMSVSYGKGSGNAMVSMEFSFEGEAAHGAGDPWEGRSALDAVELMNAGWNYKREHLFPTQRSHYVITDGGDQPNVVPSSAKVWYFFREWNITRLKSMIESGIEIAEGAAMMTNTTMSHRYLGSAYVRYFNKVVAETMYENIKTVGLPEWSADDQKLAKATQGYLGNEEIGLETELDTIGTPVKFTLGGGSDDIADISWNVPTAVLRYPANFPNNQAHHWSSAVSMATPIAHKGCTAGAKVVARTMVDFLTKPELIDKAWDYYENVQTKEEEYRPFVGKNDKPAIHLNEGIMEDYRKEMKKYYYNPDKYDTYLEQLGIDYPKLKKSSK